MAKKFLIFAVNLLQGFWYDFVVARGGVISVKVDFSRPFVSCDLISTRTGFIVDLIGLSSTTFDRTSIQTKRVGGVSMPADFFVNSHAYVQATFKQNNIYTSPDNVVVTVMDSCKNVLQTGDCACDHITFISEGVVEFTIIPETFPQAGMYIIRWLAMMPDETQIQFDVPVTVDSELR